MPVMIEYINVIVTRKVLEEKFPGGIAAYEHSGPYLTFCSDRYITRVGFMGPQGVHWFVRTLESKGLRYIRGGRSEDIAVIDRLFGPSVPCDWLKSGDDPDDGPFVAHIEDDSRIIAKPKPIPLEEHTDHPDHKFDLRLALRYLEILLISYVVLPLVVLTPFLFLQWLLT
jgi:hypothetical protein